MPGRDTGASTAWQRLPSGRRRSANGGAVVEPATGHRRQPLGQPSHGLVVGEPHRGRLEAVAAVDEDLLRPVDEHVGHARQPEQRFERPGAQHVTSQRFVDGQDGGVADRATGGPQRLGDPVRGQVAGPVGQPPPTPSTTAGSTSATLALGAADHAATAVGTAAVSSSRQAPASGPRRERTGPRPRSSASASPRWSPIVVEHRRTDERRRRDSGRHRGHAPRDRRGPGRAAPPPAGPRRRRR